MMSETIRRWQLMDEFTISRIVQIWKPRAAIRRPTQRITIYLLKNIEILRSYNDGKKYCQIFLSVEKEVAV